MSVSVTENEAASAALSAFEASVDSAGVWMRTLLPPITVTEDGVSPAAITASRAWVTD